MYLKKNCDNERAFTLLELLVVTIIIGVLVSLVLPRYDIVTERMRATEGVNHLIAILGAERRWALDQNPQQYTATLGNLDFQMPGGWNNFQAPTLFTPALGSDATLATIQRNVLGGDPFLYTLSITERIGTISCSGGAAGICAKLGF